VENDSSNANNSRDRRAETMEAIPMNSISGKQDKSPPKANASNAGTIEAVFAAHGLAPPQFVPRSRTLAESEMWQFVVKRVIERSGHPPRCHQAACRRSRKCMGGKDACYLRDFEFVDVFLQECVLSKLKKELEQRALEP
jgi:hypothetical protein